MNDTIPPRVHVSLDVADLERSIDFYRALFGVEPTKVRADYAKFEPDEPAIHLALNLVDRASPPGRLSHLGVRLGSVGALRTAAERLAATGLVPRPESGTCCYAVQEKVWVTDPDGTPWEFYAVLADAPVRDAGPACCAPPAARSGA